MTMNTSFVRLTLAAALVGAALSAHAITFGDDFSVAQSADAFNTNDNAFGTQVADPFGSIGTRIIASFNSVNAFPGNARSRVSIHDGALTYSSDQEVTGFGYDVYAFSTPQDFTTSPNVDVEILSNDIPGIISIKTQDSLLGEKNTTITLPVVTTSTHFTLNNVFAGLDITKITYFYLIVGGTQAEDVKVGGFQAVPEPASMLALGVGAAALLRRRKR